LKQAAVKSGWWPIKPVPYPNLRVIRREAQHHVSYCRRISLQYYLSIRIVTAVFYGTFSGANLRWHRHVAKPTRRRTMDLSMTFADLSSSLPAMLPRLWAFALRISGDRYDAEYLVQRACLHALEGAHQSQANTAPLGWMFSIIYFTWIVELRAHRVRNRSSAEWDDDFCTTVADSAARTPEGDVINRQIVGVVQGLPEAQRVVMLLVAVEGLSYREAAEILRVPIGTVANRLSHAQQAIGALFSKRNNRKMELPKKDGNREHKSGRLPF